MYEPPLHRQTDVAAMLQLIAAHPLGLLISHGASGLVANPVPFLHERAGEHGRLRAHVARANGQWRELAEAPDALIVFQGVQHYVTPSWYATKRETGRVVPTWNYLIVQVRGRVRIIEDAGWLRRQIGELTDMMETPRSTPWKVEDAPEDYVAMQMRAIVGLEIDIVDIAGKWKVSQNRSAADRAGVVAGLGAEKDAAAAAMAAIVELGK